MTSFSIFRGTYWDLFILTLLQLYRLVNRLRLLR